MLDCLKQGVTNASAKTMEGITEVAITVLEEGTPPVHSMRQETPQHHINVQLSQKDFHEIKR